MTEVKLTVDKGIIILYLLKNPSAKIIRDYFVMCGQEAPFHYADEYERRKKALNSDDKSDADISKYVDISRDFVDFYERYVENYGEEASVATVLQVIFAHL